MGYDIMLLMPFDENYLRVCSALKCSGINVSRIDDTDGVKAGLISRSPAFVLLDFGTKNAASLLYELSQCLFRAFPFIIVSAAFTDGADRAAMLSSGADACIDHPINLDEFLAVINAVQRRERRIAGLNFGRLLPCIEYEDLKIDPL